MRLLLNDLADVDAPAPTGSLDEAALATLYAYPTRDEAATWVRANIVSTLDGAATGEDGRTGSINTRADRLVFGLLRAHADVIVVGAGTARAEGYHRPRVADRWRELGLRRGSPAHPTLAVVSRAADVPSGLVREHADTGEVLLVTCADAGQEAIGIARETLGPERVLVAGSASVDPGAAFAELARRGLRRVLCEGGPHLLHDVISAGCLDELCLTLAPKLVAGERPRILTGSSLDDDFAPCLLLESEGTLLGRWVRSRA